MYSRYNEWKSAVVERFSRTLKNKIIKHITAFSKNFFTAFLQLIPTPNTIKISVEKIRNLKLVIMSESQNTKTFLLKDILKIGQKKF